MKLSALSIYLFAATVAADACYDAFLKCIQGTEAKIACKKDYYVCEHPGDPSGLHFDANAPDPTH